MDDVSLLKSLLSAGGHGESPRSDALLLQNLLSKAPRRLRLNRKLILFEAMHVLDLENPNSDYLAWLFDRDGPLTDNWLLTLLLERVAPNRTWAGDPVVEREVAVDNGRLDILVSWDDFRLIIENKVWSVEGEDQIARYLASSEIRSSAEGLIIFLTPDGRKPSGIQPDGRVVSLGYRDIATLIDTGLNSGREPEARGRIFAEELRSGIRRLLKLQEGTMNKPSISESTKIYVGQAKRLAEIKDHAIDEFYDFLQWMYSEAARRLETVLKSQVVVQRGKYVTLIREPEWVIAGMGYGFYFGAEVDSEKRLLSEPTSGPWAGVGTWRLDDVVDQTGCQKVVDLLSPELAKVWPEKQDFRTPDWSMALWREMRIPADGNLDQWAESIFAYFEKLAKTLVPVLSTFAKKLG